MLLLLVDLAIVLHVGRQLEIVLLLLVKLLHLFDDVHGGLFEELDVFEVIRQKVGVAGLLLFLDFEENYLETIDQLLENLLQIHQPLVILVLYYMYVLHLVGVSGARLLFCILIDGVRIALVRQVLLNLKFLQRRALRQ